MASTKVIREAKARLADLEAQRAAYVKEAEAIEAAAKPAKERQAKLRAKRAKVPMLVKTASGWLIGSMGSLVAEVRYDRTGLEHKTAKEIADAIETGGIKVQAVSGNSYSARGLAPRLRTIDKPTFAAYLRAKKAEDKVQAALYRAKNATVTALGLAFAAGGKVDQATLVASLTEQAVIDIKVGAAASALDLRRKINDMVAWEGAPIPAAKAHLAFAQSGGTGPCPCPACAKVRAAAERNRAEAERRAALPTQLVTCERHGRKRMAWEVRREFARSGEPVGDLLGPEILGDYGRWLELPVAYCPPRGKDGEGHEIVLVSVYKAEREKAAKAAAKAERKAA